LRGIEMNLALGTKHYHKYIRIALNKKRKIDGARVYKCITPGCTHFIAENLAEGRLCLCWVCDELFTITKKAMKLKKPHCDKCYSRTDLRKSAAIPPAVQLEETKKDWITILSRLEEKK
jgi:hypothetical protein